jgi:hypothetical protein
VIRRPGERQLVSGELGREWTRQRFQQRLREEAERRDEVLSLYRQQLVHQGHFQTHTYQQACASTLEQASTI